MAFDIELATRIRTQLQTRSDVVDKKMFGGLCFMVRGHMTLGVIKDDLVVRIGKENHDRWGSLPGVRPMDFTGRVMKSMLYVDAQSVADDADLIAWIDRALEYNATQKPK